MLRFLSDENLNGDLVRGLLRRQPDLDLLRVQDMNLLEADDPDILEWAAAHDRIVLTHDGATMPNFAYERIVAEKAMPGLFVINDRLSVQRAIRESF